MRNSRAWLSSLFLACLASGLTGQTTAADAKVDTKVEMKGIPARASASEYQSQAKAGSVTIGADFTGHSVPKPEGPLLTEDFVVIEVGFFGAPEAKLTLSVNDFSLKINGKKGNMASVPFGMVTTSLKDPEWVPPDTGSPDKPKSKTGLSTGGGGGGEDTPKIVHVPIELRRAMALYLQKASLPEGERMLPAAGLIFFRYTSQVKSIHSIELTYSGPAGAATLALQP